MQTRQPIGTANFVSAVHSSQYHEVRFRPDQRTWAIWVVAGWCEQGDVTREQYFQLCDRIVELTWEPGL